MQLFSVDGTVPFAFGTTGTLAVIRATVAEGATGTNRSECYGVFGAGRHHHTDSR